MASRYLEPRLERASRATLQALQLKRLRAQVAHAAAHSPIYRRKLAAAGVKPRLRALEDLRALPFTTKDELKDNQAARPPWGDVLAVPFDDVLRIHMTSATTGRPLAFLDTADDWYGFYHSYARSLHAFGVRKADMVMAAFSYGPWIGYCRASSRQDLAASGSRRRTLTTSDRRAHDYPITVLGARLVRAVSPSTRPGRA